MKRQVFGAVWLAALLFLVSGCTSGEVTPTIKTTAAGNEATARLPDLAGPAELEDALMSFGECVEESFPIAMRFSVETFTGLETEVGSLHEEDGDRVDNVTAECNARLDLDRRLGVYQGEHSITPTDRQKLVEDFISCAVNVSPEVAELVAQADLDTQTDVETFMLDMHPQRSGLTGAELVAVSDCHSEMTGPRMVFNDGYPWFTP
jgi:hypothetical protein